MSLAGIELLLRLSYVSAPSRVQGWEQVPHTEINRPHSHASTITPLDNPERVFKKADPSNALKARCWLPSARPHSHQACNSSTYSNKKDARLRKQLDLHRRALEHKSSFDLKLVIENPPRSHIHWENSLHKLTGVRPLSPAAPPPLSPLPSLPVPPPSARVSPPCLCT
jgi:hypothetical protein